MDIELLAIVKTSSIESIAFAHSGIFFRPQ